MYLVILIIFGIGWLVITVISGLISDAKSANIKKQLFREKRKIYRERVLDYSRSIFDRNKDIVKEFEDKIVANAPENTYRYNSRYKSYTPPAQYYIENHTRDCINQIALAENRADIYPDYEYLSQWKLKAPIEWQELATKIELMFRDKQQDLIKIEEENRTRKQLLEKERAEKERKKRLERWEQEETIKEIEKNVRRYRSEFHEIRAGRKEPSLLRKILKRKEKGDISIEDIPLILSPDLHSWTESEEELISRLYRPNPFALFSTKDEVGNRLDSVYVLNREIDEFNKTLEKDVQQIVDVRDFFKNIRTGYVNGKKESVVERFNFVVNSITLPFSIPKIWDIDFDEEQGILIIEIKLPDVVHSKVLKEVNLKSGIVKKPLTQKEQRDIVPNIHPAIMLKIAYEIFRNDYSDVIKLLVLNGWVEFDDPTTGNKTRVYTASLASKKEQINQLKLSKLDPVSAFAGLKGKSAGKLIDIIPVSPMMSLDRKDKRFIETKEVLGHLDNQTNLASMDWQDFENLIAELFQKEFSEEGTEIKLTQSSRDKGVDAIVFNPDPIRGGKYVIQAKRYTNTVDVSAVRDLVAVVAHEGASRGILVTTSTFGADAYAFVQNKPITLLDGSKLLGLLEKHGYKFRVNLAEARKLYPNNHRY